MATFTIGDGQTVQTAQNGSGDTYVLTGSSTIVSAGADLIFASNSGNSTVYATGINAANGQYQGDTVVLGAAHATVLVGGIGAMIYGGSGPADLFFAAPATLVTGSGNLNIIGNPTGAGIFWGGGIVSETQDSSGLTVRTGLGATDHLFAAGPVS